jgi:SAM-dependent methyltransferase
MTETTLSQRTYTTLRQARAVAYRAASLIDTPINVLTGRHPYPPLYLRRDVGSPKHFAKSAAVMNDRLKRLCNLTAESRLLDMGCGCGASALPLRGYFTSGSFLGVDVDPRMIRWCDRHIASSKLQFAHYPYWNALYNPSGERFKPFPVDDASADVIVMKSVFTHMLPQDVAYYVSELGRVLAPGAKGLVTAFTYSDTRPRDDEFPYRRDDFKHAKPISPESKLALPQQWLVESFDKAGVDVAIDMRPGSQQDHMVIHRRALS